MLQLIDGQKIFGHTAGIVDLLSSQTEVQGILQVRSSAYGENKSYSASAGHYGTLLIDSMGRWSYQLSDNPGSDVNLLATGNSLHDIISVTVSDESGNSITTNIEITINGKDRSPLLSGNPSITSTPTVNAITDLSGIALFRDLSLQSDPHYPQVQSFSIKLSGFDSENDYFVFGNQQLALNITNTIVATIDGQQLQLSYNASTNSIQLKRLANSVDEWSASSALVALSEIKFRSISADRTTREFKVQGVAGNGLASQDFKVNLEVPIIPSPLLDLNGAASGTGINILPLAQDIVDDDGINLFSDTQLININTISSIKKLVFTLSSIDYNRDQLIIGSSNISLNANYESVLNLNGALFKVSFAKDSNKLNITVQSSDGISTESTKALLTQIKFRSSSARSDERVINLAIEEITGLRSLPSKIALKMPELSVAQLDLNGAQSGSGINHLVLAEDLVSGVAIASSASLSSSTLSGVSSLEISLKGFYLGDYLSVFGESLLLNLSGSGVLDAQQLAWSYNQAKQVISYKSVSGELSADSIQTILQNTKLLATQAINGERYFEIGVTSNIGLRSQLVLVGVKVTGGVDSVPAMIDINGSEQAGSDFDLSVNHADLLTGTALMDFALQVKEPELKSLQIQMVGLVVDNADNHVSTDRFLVGDKVISLNKTSEKDNKGEVDLGILGVVLWKYDTDKQTLEIKVKGKDGKPNNFSSSTAQGILRRLGFQSDAFVDRKLHFLFRSESALGVISSPAKVHLGSSGANSNLQLDLDANASGNDFGITLAPTSLKANPGIAIAGSSISITGASAISGVVIDINNAQAGDCLSVDGRLLGLYKSYSYKHFSVDGKGYVVSFDSVRSRLILRPDEAGHWDAIALQNLISAIRYVPEKVLAGSVSLDIRLLEASGAVSQKSRARLVLNADAIGGVLDLNGSDSGVDVLLQVTKQQLVAEEGLRLITETVVVEGNSTDKYQSIILEGIAGSGDSHSGSFSFDGKSWFSMRGNVSQKAGILSTGAGFRYIYEYASKKITIVGANNSSLLSGEEVNEVLSKIMYRGSSEGREVGWRISIKDSQDLTTSTAKVQIRLPQEANNDDTDKADDNDGDSEELSNLVAPSKLANYDLSLDEFKKVLGLQSYWQIFAKILAQGNSVQVSNWQGFWVRLQELGVLGSSPDSVNLQIAREVVSRVNGYVSEVKKRVMVVIPSSSVSELELIDLQKEVRKLWLVANSADNGWSSLGEDWSDSRQLALRLQNAGLTVNLAGHGEEGSGDDVVRDTGSELKYSAKQDTLGKWDRELSLRLYRKQQERRGAADVVVAREMQSLYLWLRTLIVEQSQDNVDKVVIGSKEQYDRLIFALAKVGYIDVEGEGANNIWRVSRGILEQVVEVLRGITAKSDFSAGINPRVVALEYLQLARMIVTRSNLFFDVNEEGIQNRLIDFAGALQSEGANGISEEEKLAEISRRYGVSAPQGFVVATELSVLVEQVASALGIGVGGRLILGSQLRVLVARTYEISQGNGWFSDEEAQRRLGYLLNKQALGLVSPIINEVDDKGLSGVLTIRGDARVGGVLSFAQNLHDVEGIEEIKTDWQYSVDGISWSELAGNSGNTLVISESLEGSVVRVRSVVTDGKGERTEVLSKEQWVWRNPGGIDQAYAVTDTVAQSKVVHRTRIDARDTQEVLGVSVDSKLVGGVQLVKGSGIARNTEVVSGIQRVYGLAQRSVIGDGGVQEVYGIANESWVNKGGELRLQRGGFLESVLMLGGKLVVAQGGEIGKVRIVGADAVLEMNWGESQNGVVEGFVGGLGNRIELKGIDGNKVKLSLGVSNSVLTVSDGSMQTRIVMDDIPAPKEEDFKLEVDSRGGVSISSLSRIHVLVHSDGEEETKKRIEEIKRNNPSLVVLELDYVEGSSGLREYKLHAGQDDATVVRVLEELTSKELLAKQVSVDIVGKVEGFSSGDVDSAKLGGLSGKEWGLSIPRLASLGVTGAANGVSLGYLKKIGKVNFIGSSGKSADGIEGSEQVAIDMEEALERLMLDAFGSLTAIDSKQGKPLLDYWGAGVTKPPEVGGSGANGGRGVVTNWREPTDIGQRINLLKAGLGESEDSTRYGYQIIVQTEDDVSALEASLRLASKHPESTAILQWDGESYRIIYGRDTIGNASGDIRWQVVGHGQSPGERDSYVGTRLGGYTAEDLAKSLEKLGKQLKGAGKSVVSEPKMVSLVACDLQDIDGAELITGSVDQLVGKSYGEIFTEKFKLLVQSLESVSARAGVVTINPYGEKNAISKSVYSIDENNRVDRVTEFYEAGKNALFNERELIALPRTRIDTSNDANPPRFGFKLPKADIQDMVDYLSMATKSGEINSAVENMVKYLNYYKDNGYYSPKGYTGSDLPKIDMSFYDLASGYLNQDTIFQNVIQSQEYLNIVAINFSFTELGLLSNTLKRYCSLKAQSADVLFCIYDDEGNYRFIDPENPTRTIPIEELPKANGKPVAWEVRPGHGRRIGDSTNSDRVYDSVGVVDRSIKNLDGSNKTSVSISAAELADALALLRAKLASSGLNYDPDVVDITSCSLEQRNLFSDTIKNIPNERSFGVDFLREYINQNSLNGFTQYLPPEIITSATERSASVVNEFSAMTGYVKDLLNPEYARNYYYAGAEVRHTYWDGNSIVHEPLLYKPTNGQEKRYTPPANDPYYKNLKPTFSIDSEELYQYEQGLPAEFVHAPITVDDINSGKVEVVVCIDGDVSTKSYIKSLIESFDGFKTIILDKSGNVLYSPGYETSGNKDISVILELMRNAGIQTNLDFIGTFADITGTAREQTTFGKMPASELAKFIDDFKLRLGITLSESSNVEITATRVITNEPRRTFASMTKKDNTFNTLIGMDDLVNARTQYSGSTGIPAFLLELQRSVEQTERPSFSMQIKDRSGLFDQMFDPDNAIWKISKELNRVEYEYNSPGADKQSTYLPAELDPTTQYRHQYIMELNNDGDRAVRTAAKYLYNKHPLKSEWFLNDGQTTTRQRGFVDEAMGDGDKIRLQIVGHVGRDEGATPLINGRSYKEIADIIEREVFRAKGITKIERISLVACRTSMGDRANNPMLSKFDMGVLLIEELAKRNYQVGSISETWDLMKVDARGKKLYGRIDSANKKIVWYEKPSGDRKLVTLDPATGKAVVTDALKHNLDLEVIDDMRLGAASGRLDAMRREELEGITINLDGVEVSAVLLDEMGARIEGQRLDEDSLGELDLADGEQDGQINGDKITFNRDDIEAFLSKGISDDELRVALEVIRSQLNERTADHLFDALPNELAHGRTADVLEQIQNHNQDRELPQEAIDALKRGNLAAERELISKLFAEKFHLSGNTPEEVMASFDRYAEQLGNVTQKEFAKFRELHPELSLAESIENLALENAARHLDGMREGQEVLSAMQWQVRDAEEFFIANRLVKKAGGESTYALNKAGLSRFLEQMDGVEIPKLMRAMQLMNELDQGQLYHQITEHLLEQETPELVNLGKTLASEDHVALGQAQERWGYANDGMAVVQTVVGIRSLVDNWQSMNARQKGLEVSTMVIGFTGFSPVMKGLEAALKVAGVGETALGLTAALTGGITAVVTGALSLTSIGLQWKDFWANGGSTNSFEYKSLVASTVITTVSTAMGIGLAGVGIASMVGLAAAGSILGAMAASAGPIGFALAAATSIVMGIVRGAMQLAEYGEYFDNVADKVGQFFAAWVGVETEAFKRAKAHKRGEEQSDAMQKSLTEQWADTKEHMAKVFEKAGYTRVVYRERSYTVAHAEIVYEQLPEGGEPGETLGEDGDPLTKKGYGSLLQSKEHYSQNESVFITGAPAGKDGEQSVMWTELGMAGGAVGGGDIAVNKNFFNLANARVTSVAGGLKDDTFSVDLSTQIESIYGFGGTDTLRLNAYLEEEANRQFNVEVQTSFDGVRRVIIRNADGSTYKEFEINSIKNLSIVARGDIRIEGTEGDDLLDASTISLAGSDNSFSVELIGGEGTNTFVLSDGAKATSISDDMFLWSKGGSATIDMVKTGSKVTQGGLISLAYSYEKVNIRRSGLNLVLVAPDGKTLTINHVFDKQEKVRKNRNYSFQSTDGRMFSLNIPDGMANEEEYSLAQISKTFSLRAQQSGEEVVRHIHGDLAANTYWVAQDAGEVLVDIETTHWVTLMLDTSIGKEGSDDEALSYEFDGDGSTLYLWGTKAGKSFRVQILNYKEVKSQLKIYTNNGKPGSDKGIQLLNLPNSGFGEVTHKEVFGKQVEDDTTSPIQDELIEETGAVTINLSGLEQKHWLVEVADLSRLKLLADNDLEVRFVRYGEDLLVFDGRKVNAKSGISTSSYVRIKGYFSGLGGRLEGVPTVDHGIYLNGVQRSLKDILAVMDMYLGGDGEDRIEINNAGGVNLGQVAGGSGKDLYVVDMSIGQIVVIDNTSADTNTDILSLSNIVLGDIVWKDDGNDLVLTNEVNKAQVRLKGYYEGANKRHIVLQVGGEKYVIGMTFNDDTAYYYADLEQSQKIRFMDTKVHRVIEYSDRAVWGSRLEVELSVALDQYQKSVIGLDLKLERSGESIYLRGYYGHPQITGFKWSGGSFSYLDTVLPEGWNQNLRSAGDLFDYEIVPLVNAGVDTVDKINRYRNYKQGGYLQLVGVDGYERSLSGSSSLNFFIPLHHPESYGVGRVRVFRAWAADGERVRSEVEFYIDINNNLMVRAIDSSSRSMEQMLASGLNLMGARGSNEQLLISIDRSNSRLYVWKAGSSNPIANESIGTNPWSVINSALLDCNRLDLAEDTVLGENEVGANLYVGSIGNMRLGGVGNLFGVDGIGEQLRGGGLSIEFSKSLYRLGGVSGLSEKMIDELVGKFDFRGMDVISRSISYLGLGITDLLFVKKLVNDPTVSLDTVDGERAKILLGVKRKNGDGKLELVDRDAVLAATLLRDIPITDVIEYLKSGVGSKEDLLYLHRLMNEDVDLRVIKGGVAGSRVDLFEKALLLSGHTQELSKLLSSYVADMGLGYKGEIIEFLDAGYRDLREIRDYLQTSFVGHGGRRFNLNLSTIREADKLLESYRSGDRRGRIAVEISDNLGEHKDKFNIKLGDRYIDSKGNTVEAGEILDAGVFSEIEQKGRGSDKYINEWLTIKSDVGEEVLDVSATREDVTSWRGKSQPENLVDGWYGKDSSYDEVQSWSWENEKYKDSDNKEQERSKVLASDGYIDFKLADVVHASGLRLICKIEVALYDSITVKVQGVRGGNVDDKVDLTNWLLIDRNVLDKENGINLFFTNNFSEDSQRYYDSYRLVIKQGTLPTKMFLEEVGFISSGLDTPIVTKFSIDLSNGVVQENGKLGVGGELELVATMSSRVIAGGQFRAKLNTGDWVVFRAEDEGSTLRAKYRVSSGHSANKLRVESYEIGAVKSSGHNAPMTSNELPGENFNADIGILGEIPELLLDTTKSEGEEGGKGGKGVVVSKRLVEVGLGVLAREGVSLDNDKAPARIEKADGIAAIVIKINDEQGQVEDIGDSSGGLYVELVIGSGLSIGGVGGLVVRGEGFGSSAKVKVVEISKEVGSMSVLEAEKVIRSLSYRSRHNVGSEVEINVAVENLVGNVSNSSDMVVRGVRSDLVLEEVKDVVTGRRVVDGGSCGDRVILRYSLLGAGIDLGVVSAGIGGRGYKLSVYDGDGVLVSKGIREEDYRAGYIEVEVSLSVEGNHSLSARLYLEDSVGNGNLLARSGARVVYVDKTAPVLGGVKGIGSSGYEQNVRLEALGIGVLISDSRNGIDVSEASGEIKVIELSLGGAGYSVGEEVLVIGGIELLSGERELSGELVKVEVSGNRYRIESKSKRGVMGVGVARGILQSLVYMSKAGGLVIEGERRVGIVVEDGAGNISWELESVLNVLSDMRASGDVGIRASNLENGKVSLEAVVSEVRDVDGLGEFSYQWQVKGVGGIWKDIVGETGGSYVVMPLKEGEDYRVGVSFRDGKDIEEKVISSMYRVDAYSGPSAVGSIGRQEATEDEEFRYIVPSGLFTNSRGEVLSYSASLVGGGVLPSWLRFDASTLEFTGIPGDSAVGSVVVAIKAMNGEGEYGESRFEINVLNINDAPVGIVEITGNAKVGNTLRASNTLTDEDGMGVVSYQWQVLENGVWGGLFVVGDGRSMEVGEGELGKSLRVRAVYTDGHGSREGVYSEVVNVVGRNTPTAGNFTITGSMKVGERLKVENDFTDLEGISEIRYFYTLVESAGGSVISRRGLGGGVGSLEGELLLLEEYLGKQVEVLVEVTDGDGRSSYYGAKTSEEIRGSEGVGVPRVTKHRIEGDEQRNVLVGSGVADEIVGYGGDDILVGGGGNDTLNGGSGSDVYVVGRDVGMETEVIEEEEVGDKNEVKFLEDINAEDLWFKREGEDLEVEVLGRVVGESSRVVIRDWYKAGSVLIEEFSLRDGKKLGGVDVSKLVEVMSAFDVPASGLGGGWSGIGDRDKERIVEAISANWK